MTRTTTLLLTGLLASSLGCSDDAPSTPPPPSDSGSPDAAGRDAGGGDAGGRDADLPPPGDGGSITCGAITCGADEYCIQPCCGGALPICLEETDAGVCPAGTAHGMCTNGAGDFTEGCTASCTPPPAFCAPSSDCTGDDCPASGDCFDGYYDPATRTFNCLCA